MGLSTMLHSKITLSSVQQVRIALSSGLAAGLTGDTFKDGQMNADPTKLSQKKYNF